MTEKEQPHFASCSSLLEPGSSANQNFTQRTKKSIIQLSIEPCVSHCHLHQSSHHHLPHPNLLFLEGFFLKFPQCSPSRIISSSSSSEMDLRRATLEGKGTFLCQKKEKTKSFFAVFVSAPFGIPKNSLLRPKFAGDGVRSVGGGRGGARKVLSPVEVKKS
jgi:hypothetical protein